MTTSSRASQTSRERHRQNPPHWPKSLNRHWINTAIQRRMTAHPSRLCASGISRKAKGKLNHECPYCPALARSGFAGTRVTGNSRYGLQRLCPICLRSASPGYAVQAELAYRGNDAQGLSGCLRRGETAHHQRAAPPFEVDRGLGGFAGVVSRPQPVRARGLRFLFGRLGKDPRQ